MTKLGRKFAERMYETGITLDDDWVSESVTVSNGFSFALQVFMFNDNDAYGTLSVETRAHSQMDSWHEIPLVDDGGIEINPLVVTLDELYDIGCLGAGEIRVKYNRDSGSAVMDIAGLRKKIHG